ncbi:MAG: aminotransferase class V-fold PLP-dependent enzyme [Bacteroidales bacterium]|nr:aminotransferase class V-fold PLP-dependent enzyme [Bacteroidales bacterium]
MDRSFFIKSIAALSAAGLSAPGMTARSVGYNSVQDAFTGAGQEDWDYLRKHFSLPEDYRYFNTAGIGAVPISVREQVARYWDDTEIHPKPGHNHKAWQSVKLAVSDSIGGKPSNIALTNSATEGINIILNGFPWKAGDEIICSTHEHPALHAPLINISQQKGVKLRIFEPDLVDGLNNISRIFNLASPKTRLIFVSIVTCTTGQRLPIEEIVDEAHRRGILVAIDGAQCTGSRALDIADWDVDFYASGGQKWLLGPKRTGLLYLKEEHLDLIRPTTVGAYSEQGYDVFKNEIAWASDATRYEYATQNDSLFSGLKKSISFLSELGFDNIRSHNEELAEKLYQGLSENEDVYLISPEQREFRTSIISFGLSSMNYLDLAKKLGIAGFRVRVVFEAGLQAVRVSIHIYNSDEEIDALIEAVNYLSA